MGVTQPLTVVLAEPQRGLQHQGQPSTIHLKSVHYGLTRAQDRAILRTKPQNSVKE